MKSVLVLSGGKTRTQDRNLAATATRFGAVVDVAELTDLTSSDGGQVWARMASSTAVATRADSLAALCRDERSRAIALEQFLGMDALFVYGVVPQVHDELIKWISAGKLEAVRPIEGGETCDLPEAGREFTRQLAGSSFARGKGAKASGVVVTEGDGVTPLLTVSRKPTFVHVEGPSSRQGRRQPRSLFVSTAVEFPDPNQPMAAEEDIDAFYETLVPQLVFVRAVCGEFCWHGAHGTARLIIDDPVLRRVYGYLDFARLFESVRRHGYAASVAYIPWNYTRTQKDRAAFFRAAGAQFSLCVHGCDHTNDEYGSPDEVYLSQKSSLAMDRMRRHEVRTGMPFEPVMVFPQGRFSTAGLRGLRSSGFLAAINSSRFPVDVDAAPLSLWDLLEPASLRPHGLPVFCRHYVEPTFPLLFDLFLGRPAFIVEHHEFFKSGFPTMEALADRLNEVEPRLLWGSLSDAVEQACWKRAVSDTSWEVRFFTDRFVMSNDSDRRVSYRLLKEEPERDAVESASINARTVTPDRAGGQIIFELTLDPGETARVELRPSAGPARAGVSEGKVYASKVLMRRALSEFRDEFLVKHPVMLASAKRIVRVLKASSDSLPRPGAERTVSR